MLASIADDEPTVTVCGLPGDVAGVTEWVPVGGVVEAPVCDGRGLVVFELARSFKTRPSDNCTLQL